MTTGAGNRNETTDLPLLRRPKNQAGLNSIYAFTRQVRGTVNVTYVASRRDLVTTVGYARYRARHLTVDPEVVAVTLEWLALAPAALPASSDASDKSDRSDVLAREAARLPEVERTTEPTGGGLQVAATEHPSTIGPLSSAAPATELQTAAAGGP